ncbi:MAG: hypothetical protein KDK61_08680 [Simkania sp.]|nr:hypothetical protein [Nanoarchaeota archaeon]MCB1084372.1 hypothetical protein [Simkania sp.]
MIETFDTFKLIESKANIISSVDYRNELVDSLKTNVLLPFYLQKVRHATGTFTSLYASYFVIDSFRIHDTLPRIGKDTYDLISQIWKNFSPTARISYLNETLASIMDKNEFYAKQVMELSTDYEDRSGESMLIYRLIEKQKENDQNKPMFLN